MLRARERFERSDVPEPSARRNIAALIALVAVVAGLFILWNTLWTRAQRESNLDVRDLARALNSQGETVEFDEVTVVDDDFERMLLIIVSDFEEQTPVGVQFIIRRAAGGPVYAADIPLNVRVRNSDGAYTTFTEMSAAEGLIPAVQALATPINIRSNHLMLCTEGPWEAIQELAKTSDKRVVDSNPELLDKLRSDLTNDELLELADAIDANSGLSYVDVRIYDEEIANSAGEMESTGRVTIGRVRLGLDVGWYEQNEEA